MSRDEHDRRKASFGELALEIQAIDVRKLHVQHQAGRNVGLRIGQVLGRGTEGDGVQIEARKKLGERLADPTVVVDDEDDVVLRIGHSVIVLRVEGRRWHIGRARHDP